MQITGLFTGGFFEGDEPQAPLGLRHAKANATALEHFPTVGEKSVMGLRVTRKGAIDSIYLLRFSFIQHHFKEQEEFQMAIYLANGNPIIATVLMALSTFNTVALGASFPSISLSFASSEAAKKFAEDVRMSLANILDARLELNNVVVSFGYSNSYSAAEAVYYAVNSYKDSLISVNFEIAASAFDEDAQNLLKDIEQYIKQYFGEDAITVK